jgi:para-nitrobenzyl esterase
MIRCLIRCPATRGRLFAPAIVFVFGSVLSVVTACSSDDAKPDPTHIALADGELQGSVVGSSRQFLGIPYAKPPVGALRWQSPQPPDKWTSPRDATQFGKRCAQLASPVLQNAASSDEDCLYLNVWTPSPAPSASLPVMVWIHGGGNVNGSASEPVPFANTGVFYSGQFLAESHAVVVVSMNYRLGVFGFFAHAALTADPDGRSGNQGLQDQQMALQWVHDNIARFGGDPGNVTIFGESAGSLDVCLHVAAPTSAGLFQRAIGESGGCTTLQTTKAEAETAAAKLATDLGCAGGDVIGCLRGKPVSEIMASADVAAGIGFDVDVDGWFLPDQPRAIYDAGNISDVPYLLGSNTDEGTLFLPATGPTTEDEYTAVLTQRYGASLAAQVQAMYPVANFAAGMPNAPTAALARVIGDSLLVCSTLDTAERAAHAGSKVYMYNFDIPVPIPGSSLGATHGSELTSVFGTSTTFTADTKAVSDLMQRYWTHFARTGDPNGGSDPQWPAFTETANTRINFGVSPAIITDFRANECAFWQSIYDAQFSPPAR